MTVGLVANKLGMTRIFTENGTSIPVTVLQVCDNKVVQTKSKDSDGYSAIQVSYGTKKASRVNKPIAGHYAKAKVAPGKGLLEFRLNDKSPSFETGQELTVEMFEGISKVDATAFSKGKGFQGVMKRYNFKTQDATHGNSLAHRAPGSIGQNQTPGKVFKGKKMAGHMGDEKTTVQNLELVKIDQERGLLFVKGGVPGAPTGKVVVKPAVKTLHKESA